jgi:large subunit ribosomal protein L28
MSEKCVICLKTTQVGNNVSHALNRTKRTWEANLQRVRANINGEVRRVKVCTRCLRSNKVKKVVS